MTNQRGEFRLTWLVPGKYRMLADVFDPSTRRYRTWFYPGVADEEAASEIEVGEDQKIDAGSWKISMEQPGADPLENGDR